MPSRLLEWFVSLESLPWRDDSDIYSVMILEILSQQTTLPVMLRRYPLFLDRFPTLEDLAKGSEEEILLAWEGLGYYRRAMNLHKLAKKLVEEGYPPPTMEAWIKLPGIGSYTAAAILSRSFNIPVLSVDVNVKRIMTRFLAVDRYTPQIEKQFVEFFALELAENARYLSQALIRVGQLVCKKKVTICSDCPLNDRCQSAYKNRDNEVSDHKKIINKESFLLLLYHEKKFLLEKQTTGIGKNLYRIPRVNKELWQHISAHYASIQLKSRVHCYTHYRDKLFPLLVGDSGLLHGDNYTWVDEESLSSKPFMSTYRFIINEAISECKNLGFLLSLR